MVLSPITSLTHPITRLVRRTERLAAVAVTLAASSPSAHASLAVQEIVRATPTADQVIIAPVSRFATNMQIARDSGQYSKDLLKRVEVSKNRELAAQILADGAAAHDACEAGADFCETLTKKACEAEAKAAKPHASTKAKRDETPEKCIEQTACKITFAEKCNSVWNRYKRLALDILLNDN